MTIESDAVIREVEEHRALFATRCAKLAGRIAAMQAVIDARETENAALREEVLALKSAGQDAQ